MLKIKSNIQLYFVRFFLIAIAVAVYSSAKGAPSPQDALEYAESVENGIKSGERLLKTKPRDSAIGAHSRKMTELMNKGRGFSVKEVFDGGYDVCAGLGAVAWNYWMNVMVAKWNKSPDRYGDYGKIEDAYRDSLDECRKSAVSAEN